MPNKYLLILLVVVLAIGGYVWLRHFGVIGRGLGPGPEEDFSGLLQAMEKEDAETYLSYFTQESQEMILKSPKLEPTAEKLAADFEKYRKGRFQVVEHTKERAVMMSGAYGYLVFVKQDGEWKIDLKESFERMYGRLPD